MSWLVGGVQNFFSIKKIVKIHSEVHHLPNVIFTIYCIQLTRWGSAYSINGSFYLNLVPKWDNGGEVLLTIPQLSRTISTRRHNWLCFLAGRIGIFETGLSLCIVEEDAFSSPFEKILWKHMFTFMNFLVGSCVIWYWLKIRENGGGGLFIIKCTRKLSMFLGHATVVMFQ